MSDMSLNHSLHEASSRRTREVDAYVQARAHQRAAKASRLHLEERRTRRLRALTVAAPMVVLAALVTRF